MKRRVLRITAIILVSIVSVSLAYIGYGELVLRPKGRQVWTKLTLESLGRACELYHTHQGQPPESLTDLFHNSSNIVYNSVEDEHRATNDAWGRPLYFGRFDPARGYGFVASHGRDGYPGGEGLDADIEVHFGSGRR